ncbi:MAG: TonB-dependent receptor [Edaphobacter sp.]
MRTKPVQEAVLGYTDRIDRFAPLVHSSGSVGTVFQKLLRQGTLFCLIALALAVSPLPPQTDRGTITGIVADSGGAVLPDAALIMTDVASGTVYKGAATSTGSFSIPALPVGTYSLSVSHPGFRDYVQNGIKISVAQTTRQNITLQVGAASETITVTADAALLKTENAEQSTTVSTTALNQLPVAFALQGNIRDPLAFAKLVPGVETPVVVNPSNSITVNGLPGNTFKITVDGMDSTSANSNAREDNNHPSAEMLEGYTLQSSNFSAEFGQVGGGLFNFSVRSGTNSLHGSIYENFANEALNANQPFSSLSNAAGGYVDKKIRNRQNDYGFTIGGPVRIPFLYDGRDKTFFFAGWEHYGQSNGVQVVQSVPTDRMRNGDFGEILTGRVLATDPLGRPIMENAIYDPSTARVVKGQVVTDPFPGNVIPHSSLDPVALKAQNYIPKATLPGYLNNFAPIAISPVTSDIPAFKIDQVISQNFKTSFYYSRMTSHLSNSNDGLPFPISSLRPTSAIVDTYRLNNDYTVTPNLLIHFGAGYTRWPNSDSSPAEVTSYNAATGLGLPGALDLGFPRLGGLGSSVGGIVNGPNGSGIGPTQRNHYWMDKATGIANTTWTRANHTFKAGVEYKNDMWLSNSAANVAGNYTFSAAETALPYKGNNTFGTGAQAGTIGMPYASFLLGQVDNGVLANEVVAQYHRPTWSFFAQDTWKALRNLTIDYGMRWDFTQTQREHAYRTSGFSPKVANPNAGGRLGAMMYEGFGPGDCNCNFMPHYPYAFGPRLGVAYQLDEKTVFRAGFGVTYGQPPAFGYYGSSGIVGVGFNTLNFSSPTYGTANTSLSKGFQYDPASVTDASRDPGYGCCSKVNSAPSSYFAPNGGKPPRILNFTVSMQHQFGRDFAVEMSYVGNRAVWLQSNGLTDLNAISPARLATFGLDPTNLNDAKELSKTFAAANADFPGRFPIPYASFPVGSTLSQALRPFPQYGTISARFLPAGKSWYDALQIKATKRLSHGLEFLDAFTWSKELTIGQQINNVLDFPSNKYLTASFTPFINVTSLTYTLAPLPFHTFQTNPLLRETLSGWTVAGIFKYQSGQLIHAPGAHPGSYPALGNVLQRNTWANRVPGQPLFVKNPNCHCFNAANPTDVVLNYKAWAEPAVGTYASGAPYYNDYRWQRQPDEEFTIGKKFFVPVGHKEPATLQIRAEFFNIFNRTLYPLATGGSSSGTFDSFETNVTNNTTTSAFGANNPQKFDRTEYRTGQLVVRFEF